jgi:protein-tyrosine-phosphatase
MPSVLFVCTANICRSPLALALFKQKISGAPDANMWKLDSAGTWAPEGEPASGKSQFLLRERGIGIQDHRSKSVSSELLRSFNLILTMERGQKEALQAEFPDIKNRVYMISEMIGQRFDIDDPYNGTLDDYREAMQEIEQILNMGFDKICSLAQDRTDEKGS